MAVFACLDRWLWGIMDAGMSENAGDQCYAVHVFCTVLAILERQNQIPTFLLKLIIDGKTGRRLRGEKERDREEMM